MSEPRNLNRLAYFVAVADHGGFTQAAEHLGVNKGLVSRQVASLEEEVGARLLERSTRRVELTQAGRSFHHRATQILRQAEDAYAEIAQDTAAPRGTLRITAPHDYGNSVAIPAVADFLARHPDCRAEVRLNDQTLDLMSGDFDLAIRVGWLSDSSLKARRIGSFDQVMVAAPAFADRLARLATPDELAKFPFVANAMLRDPTTWQFSGPGQQQILLQAHGTLTVNTTQAVHAAVLQGLGLGVMPDFAVRHDIATGALLHVMPGWQLPAGGIHLVFPASRFRPSRVAAFIDILVARHAATAR